MSRAFASQGDVEQKKVTFLRLSEHAWAYTAEGDPNTGIVVGDGAPPRERQRSTRRAQRR